MAATNSRTLKPLNSFAINAQARRIITAYTEVELLTLWQQAVNDNVPVMVLGGGSNVFFLEDYAGTVLLNRIVGIKIEECHDAWYLHVSAGVVWHDLVRICLEQRMPGLENLALIPGSIHFGEVFL